MGRAVPKYNKLRDKKDKKKRKWRRKIRRDFGSINQKIEIALPLPLEIKSSSLFCKFPWLSVHLVEPH
jgi:hypothetical protein